MANIQDYLNDLEARLAPSLDANALQERLTEAEVHLRDRAQEFEEIGLPPHEAEAQAVAAFGKVDDYVEDVPAVVVPPPAPLVKPPRDLTVQIAGSVLAFGVAIGLWAEGGIFMVASLLAAIVVGFGALFGAATGLKRLGLLSAAYAGALFVVLMIAYLPGYEPFVMMNRKSVGMGEPSGRTPSIDDFHFFEHCERRFGEDGSFERGSGGRIYAPSLGRTLMAYPPDATADAAQAWRDYGPATRLNLLRRAERNGLYINVGAGLLDRMKAFTMQSLFFGFVLMALMTGLQGLGLATRYGVQRALAAIRRLGTPRAFEGSRDLR